MIETKRLLLREFMEGYLSVILAAVFVFFVSALC